MNNRRSSRASRSSSYVRQFLKRHGLRKTQVIEAETKAIHWISAANVLVNQGYARLTDNDFKNRPALGFILNLIHRAFEHAEAAMVAFVTGSGPSAEGISRITVELSISILYILKGQPESRLLAFFQKYVENEERRLNNWQKSIGQLSTEGQDEHQKAIAHRRSGVEAYRLVISRLQSEFESANIALIDDSWPNVEQRFLGADEASGYRTFYARMSSQIHSDAEETLRYFFWKISDNPALCERMTWETILFTRFLVYIAVRYFLLASVEYTSLYQLRTEERQLRQGLHIISDELQHLVSQLDDRPRV